MLSCPAFCIKYCRPEKYQAGIRQFHAGILFVRQCQDWILPLTPSMYYLLEPKKQQTANKSLLGDRYTKSGYVCVKRSRTLFSRFYPPLFPPPYVFTTPIFIGIHSAVGVQYIKLPFETLCRTILSMSGQSLNVELQRQFHYEPTAATTSTFVQQRGKLLPAAFEEILRRFTYQNRPIRRWDGYTLLAVDGSHVQIPSSIHDEATYFNSTKDGRGYNLLHLNALYDLESQLYLDAVIQDVREEHESRALVELVDRSELTEPVILIADRGYEAYNNMAHIEQKGWKYLIRVKDKRGILSGLRLPDAPEFDAVFSYSLSKRLTNRIRQEPQKYRWIPSKVHFD